MKRGMLIQGRENRKGQTLNTVVSKGPTGVGIAQGDEEERRLNLLSRLGHSSGKRALTSTMAWRCSGSTNAELIANMLKNNVFHSQPVANVTSSLPSISSITHCPKAMAKVDRFNYVPLKSSAYQDSPQYVLIIIIIQNRYRSCIDQSVMEQPFLLLIWFVILLI